MKNEGPTELQLAVLNGSLRDKVKIHGDIYSTGIKWDAESGHPHSPLHYQGPCTAPIWRDTLAPEYIGQRDAESIHYS